MSETPKYRAKLFTLQGTFHVFVWTLHKGQALVSDEADSEQYLVDSSRLSSFTPIEKAWT